MTYSSLAVAYGSEPAVQSVSFSVDSGEILCIIGESGSGKTTLLRAAMRELGFSGDVVEGDIQYKGQSLLSLKKKQVRDMWGGVFSYIPQDCAASFMPIKKIGVQINDALLAHRGISLRESYDEACEMMHEMDVADPARIMDSYPFELSGGLIQRVGVALALLTHPRVIFADEPTSALDNKSHDRCMRMISDTCRHEMTSCIMVTHNMNVVRSIAQKVLVLHHGSVVAYGTVREVFENNPKKIVAQLDEASKILQGGL